MRPAIIAVVLGAFGALFPTTLIDWTKRAILWPSFDNAEALEPRGWYVASVRFQSLLLALVGIVALLAGRRELDTSIPDEPDLTPSTE
jgi:hypothetical protein